MAIYEFRNIYGGTIPTMKGVVKGAYKKGCPVYREADDGKLTTCATSAANPTPVIGFLQGTSTADGDTMDFVPMYAGIQVLMDFTGTYAATIVGKNVEMTVTSGVPSANLDATTNDTLRFVELVTNDSTNSIYRAWFEVAHLANQNSTLEAS